MTPSLKDRVEHALRDTRYHPDCVDEAKNQLAIVLERYKEAGSPESMKSELYSHAIDATLMEGKYFRARVEFLSRLIALLGERPEEKLDVAEDGCGSGVDLHVVHALLADKVSLTGIDKNQASLTRARARVPNAKFIPDFQEDVYDVLYADYVSIDGNMPWEIAARGERNFNAVRSPGIVLQNTDMRQLALYVRYFGRKFSRIMQPELLAVIDGGPDCFLCRFEKSE